MGGSSGGGSSSGKSDFPDYMKAVHGLMLDGGGVDTPTISIIDSYNTATSGSSPFASYITETEPLAQAFFATGSTVNNYAKIYDLLKTFQDVNFDTSVTGYEAGLISSISTTLDDEININVLPKYKANMRSIGAVMSSAYAVGEALIWDSKVKALAREKLTIRDLALKQTLSFIDFKKQIALATTDVSKTYYILKHDTQSHYSGMNESDKKWDLEMMQYVNNTLGSIAGSALGVAAKGGSKVGSAIGGALSGAAVGAYIGSTAAGATMGLSVPIGAVIGGVVGLAGALFA
jgi:hypothetical protein